MKRLIVILLCFFLSFTMLFALESTSTGNVSLNVAINSVAIGFVNTAEEAKRATKSTISTNHSISLTQSGTEYSYNGSLEFYFYWKIMTGEKNLKVSLSTDGPLILEGKTIADATAHQKINYKLTAEKTTKTTDGGMDWMGEDSFTSKSIEGNNYASDKIDIKIKDSTNPQIYTQGLCKLTLNLLEEIKTKAYGEYGCKLTLTVTNI